MANDREELALWLWHEAEDLAVRVYLRWHDARRDGRPEAARLLRLSHRLELRVVRRAVLGVGR